MYTRSIISSSWIYRVFELAPSEKGDISVPLSEALKKSPEQIKTEQEKMVSLKVGTELSIGVHKATENERLFRGWLSEKAQQWMANQLFMQLYPESIQSDPLKEAKIIRFLENPDNLLLVKKLLEEGWDVAELKEKIGLPVDSNPHSSMLRLSEKSMSTPENPQFSEIQSESWVGTEEKKQLLKSIQSTTSDYQEVVSDRVVAQDRYETWLKDYNTKSSERDDFEWQNPKKSDIVNNKWEWSVNQDNGQSHLALDRYFASSEDRLRGELWEGSVNLVVVWDDSTGYSLRSESDIPIEETGYDKIFPTKSEARWAERRYELFSEPPLDEIRGMGPDYIDTIKNMPEIERLWQSNNPNEPFTAKGLRRLLLVGLLKKMNPEKYQDKSYNEIVHHQSLSLTEQFQSTWEQHQISWIRNTGKEGIEKILAIVKNPETWKNSENQDSIPGWPNP